MSCSSAARRMSRSTSSSKPSARAMLDRDQARAVGVAVGPRRLGVDDAGERVGDPVQLLLVGRRAAGRSAPSGERRRRQRRPERRVAAGRAAARRPARGRTSRRCGARRRRRPPSSPRAAWKISTVCARHRIRAQQRDLLAAQPSGWPRPSQCSSSARIAAAVPRPSPSSRAISAPRSQRARISERVISPSSRSASAAPRASAATRRARPSAATTGTPVGARPVDPLGAALGARSSTANSAAIRAEFAEQPASLSSSA